MRFLLPVVVVIAAQIGAAWAISQENVARPGGTYATVEAETVAACERRCADDTICMAWSFHANSCELKAIVPAAIEQHGIVSGVSARAPASMRARFEPSPPQAATIEAHEFEAEAPAAAAAPEDEISVALLGGPETEQDLRARLGN